MAKEEEGKETGELREGKKFSLPLYRDEGPRILVLCIVLVNTILFQCFLPSTSFPTILWFIHAVRYSL